MRASWITRKPAAASPHSSSRSPAIAKGQPCEPLDRRRRGTLFDEIPAAPDEVRDFYVDLDNIKVSTRWSYRCRPARHQDRRRLRADLSGARPYSIGAVAMRITYRARVDVPIHGDVITEARQFPRVRLRGVVTFEPIESGTRLTERLQHRSAPVACRDDPA